MENLLEQLERLLIENDRLFDQENKPVINGKLAKNKVVELALKLNPTLLKVLLSNESIKKHFFAEVDGILVFDKIKFQKFVSNKSFLPDSFTAFKNKIGLTVNGEFLSESKEVVLSWPYKDCVLEGGQEKEDEKRDEIFYNEVLAPDEIDRLLEPKVLTKFKRIDANGEQQVTGFSDEDNLIIKGNNLLALSSIESKFCGLFKLIYIDPPYNTGNDDFKYNDAFNHSTWLTFMKNRLNVAKNLLRDNGIIVVQIDNREQAYLEIIMNEIFSRENLLSKITLKVKSGGGVGQESFLFDICEYLLVYSKGTSKATNFLPMTEESIGENTTSVYNNVLISIGKEKYLKRIEGGNVGGIDVFTFDDYSTINLSNDERTQDNYYKYFDNIFRTTNPQGGLMKRVMPQIPSNGLVSIEYIPTKGKSAGEKYRYYFLNGALIVWLKDSAKIDNQNKTVKKLVRNNNLWTENLHQGLAKEGNVELKAGKKPERLLEKILEITTKEGDFILDYHLGSGTTCAVAHKMNRRYIGIEQLDYGENDSVVRLKNVINGDTTGISKAVGWEGGGSFIYCELKKWNELFAEKILAADDKNELLKIWEEMQHKAFLSYKITPDVIEKNVKEFSDLSLENQKKFLMEVLDKNQLYVNLSEMDDETYGVTEEEKTLNRKFYGLE